MTSNNTKPLNPKYVARLLGISEKSPAPSSTRTPSRASILRLNKDSLGKVLEKYSELVNIPDITTQRERLAMLDYNVVKLELRFKRKEEILDDINSKKATYKVDSIDDITSRVNEAHKILQNVKGLITKIKTEQKGAKELLTEFIKIKGDKQEIIKKEKEIEDVVISYINEIDFLLKSVNRKIYRIRRFIKDEEDSNQSRCIVS